MELDFDKYCVVDGSPTTVLPAPHCHSKVAYRKSNRKIKCGNDMRSLNENFAEISFNRHRSSSCRDVRSKRAYHELPKRGSVYQSSEEVNSLSRTDDFVGRKKIELSRESSSTLFPCGVIDSLCSSDEDRSLRERNRSSVMSTSEQSTSLYCKRDSLNYPFSKKGEKRSSNNNKSVEDFMVSCNSPHEIYPVVNLQKSLSAKLDLPHSPARSVSDGSKTSMFNPVRKDFDPFVKSRSRRRLLNLEKISGDTGLSCNATICETRAEDFSDNLNSLPLSSPAHLHGILKSENKNGVRFFEFSVKLPEDVYYVAKTWKVDNALTWMYTFHSIHHKPKSNASGWGIKHNYRESTMVGQMIISSYLCTELKRAGAFNNSMATEYVLYDIAQSGRSTSSQYNSSCSPDITEAPLVSDYEQDERSAKTTNKGQTRKHPQPLAVAELHPEMETAAIIMQVPFEKRESLKFKSGDSEMDDPIPNLLDLCRLEKANEGISDNSGSGKMHVVIPAGNHSLPSSESRGPSRLLDRWRLGGGCECGGWDMACPLDVFVNPNLRIAESQPLMDSRHPVELFVQGKKDNRIPAFSMRATEDGKYAVDFHARLSSLQAFSICVAIIHAAEASTAAGHEISKQMVQSDSLRVLAEEEIKNVIDAISEEDKFIANSKKEEGLPSFVINPPFSPIARV